jgi:alpha-beta hydrolase superfamily lysophospholipase
MTETEAKPTLATREWSEPSGLRVRGGVVVLGGRGEPPTIYERFGRRLSADAYRVLAFGDADGQLDRIAAEIRTAVDDGRLSKPLTLVGSDTGAVRLVDLLPRLEGMVDAIVLAGYPVAGVETSADWEIEVLERTTCPAHRATLTSDRGVERGAVARPLAAEDVARRLEAITQPVLAVHGDADLISPLDRALAVYADLPRSEVWSVAGAKHDVLNDSTHRSVAALVVTFLERLARGSADTPIVTRVA